MWSRLAALLLLAIAGSSGGCVSDPDRLFITGRDARVYNAQTGQYEWPDQ